MLQKSKRKIFAVIHVAIMVNAMPTLVNVFVISVLKKMQMAIANQMNQINQINQVHLLKLVKEQLQELHLPMTAQAKSVGHGSQVGSMKNVALERPLPMWLVEELHNWVITHTWCC